VPSRWTLPFERFGADQATQTSSGGCENDACLERSDRSDSSPHPREKSLARPVHQAAMMSSGWISAKARVSFTGCNECSIDSEE
jgi:hypothetical protein